MREPSTGRGGTQLVLDMSNPAVQDFVFKVVDDIMTETPNTYYIKWDCNMVTKNFGSHYLSADNQSHLYVDYHLGLIKTLKRIREKYPDLVIQCCASGGGRVNYGLMPYFEEFWVSDNTDAKQRLFIQWGTSMFFPACAMAQHVSASPNHQTGRRLPLKFRFDVAMTGRLGMEMKPSDLSAEEMKFAQSCFKTYKETIRPIVQQGDLYRIISPYEGNGYCSEMYVKEDKSEAIFFVYKYEHYVDFFRPRFYFAGLDPDATYTLTEICRQESADHWEGSSFTGRFLMQQGVEIGFRGEYASKVIRLVRN
jgi:alpha-galactosidase